MRKLCSFGSLSRRVFILSGMVLGVTLVVGAIHTIHTKHFQGHLTAFQNENIPRFEASYQLEDWTYSILSKANEFTQTQNPDALRSTYQSILDEIVALEAAAAGNALLVGDTSSLELNRLVEGLKHSLNTTLALRAAALNADGTGSPSAVLEQAAVNGEILLTDLEKLRELAIQNRLATFEASKNDVDVILAKVATDRRMAIAVLFACLAVTMLISVGLVTRIRAGLKEVTGVLRKKQTAFSSDFFACKDEFSTIGERVLHYIEQEEELRVIQAQAAESELKAEAYESAIANLTHDLRTPASQVSGLLELIEGQNEEGEAIARELEMAKTASRRLSSMIQDVLDITRTEMDRAEAIVEAFDPNVLLEELVTSFRYTAELRQLEMRFDDKLTVTSILQDKKRIERIVANLIDNAIKYTNSGTVELSVRNTKVINGRCDIYLTVKDTGIGIPDEQLKDIFTKFERARNHYAIDGLGLGLALVSRFTDLIGGSIAVESVVNKGTTFSVKIPCDVLEEVQALEKGEIAMTDDTKPNVLLVEDDPVNLQLATAVLKPFATVTCAMNGSEAVQKFQDKEFDLVVMDCRMPVLDGVSATREIREIEKQLCGKPIRIMGLTANASVEERNVALKAGMEDLLTKPLTKDVAKALIMN